MKEWDQSTLGDCKKSWKTRAVAVQRGGKWVGSRGQHEILVVSSEKGLDFTLEAMDRQQRMSDNSECVYVYILRM